MSRVIKFRAWDKNCKGMREVRAIQWDAHGGLDVDYYCDKMSNFAGGIDTLMQFTGLLDKNGKEIYEKDIVKFVGGNAIHTLGENSDIRLVEVLEDTNQLGWKGSGYTFCKTNCEKHVEIIGNVYEHPHLLTKSV